MNWYGTIKVAQAKPPAYVMERISDLRHACSIAKISPSNAKAIILEVIRDLSKQHDTSYAISLEKAVGRMLDNPDDASKLVMKVIAVMLSEKIEYEDEKENKRGTGTGRH